MLYRHNAAIGTNWNLCFFWIIHCNWIFPIWRRNILFLSLGPIRLVPLSFQPLHNRCEITHGKVAQSFIHICWAQIVIKRWGCKLLFISYLQSYKHFHKCYLCTYILCYWSYWASHFRISIELSAGDLVSNPIYSSE